VKRLLILSVLILSAGLLKSQQLPVFSQYLYNKFIINPAVAGSDGFTSFNLTAREQWVGYAGAPETFTFSGQYRFLKSKYKIKNAMSRKPVFRSKQDGRVGLGGYVFNDKNGLVKRTGFQAAYSYHLWVQNETQLSLGLAFTGYQFKIDEKQLSFEDPNDPMLNSDLRKGVFVPDAAFGIYLLNPRYSFGFSVDQLFQAALKIGPAAYDQFKMARQLYMFGSYTFGVDTKYEWQPSALFRMSEQLKPQVDIGLTYIYDNQLWAGLAYRTSGALIANIGFEYKNLWFGYAFDFTLQEIQRLTYGTHEFTLAVRFGDNTRKYHWRDRY
jgi:type IX secretion system PorP/SprF family membrane protein